MFHFKSTNTVDILKTSDKNFRIKIMIEMLQVAFTNSKSCSSCQQQNARKICIEILSSLEQHVLDTNTGKQLSKAVTAIKLILVMIK